MILPASYANGFAPRDGQPLYPELWRGCVGAWSTTLGPSGVTLRDWSGLGNHATLKSSGAMPSVSPAGGHNLLNLSGVQYADTGAACQALRSAARITVSAWVVTTTVSKEIVSDYSGTNDHFELYLLGSGFPAFYAYGATTGYRASSVSVTDGKLHHVLGEFNAGAINMYIDGVLANGALSGTVPATLNAAAGQPLNIGRYVNSAYFVGSIGDVFLHDRVLQDSEKRVIASRPGIAYELSPRRRSRAVVITSGFSALRPSILRGSR